MKAILAVVAAGAVAGLSGCILHHPHAHDEYYHHHRHAGVEVVVPVHHVHDYHCGHYYYRDRWYHHAAHRHGRGCGHVYHRGRWTLRM